MGGISEKLITFGYIIISLGLILSPFFIIRKFKIVKWRHIILRYILSSGIFVGIQFFYSWIDKWLYNDVYNSGWIMESLLSGNLYQWLGLSIIFIISPFFITKIRYKKFNKKRGWISFGTSLILLALMVGVWLYLIVLGAGTFINFG